MTISKRIFDVCVALLILLPLAPVVLGIALWVKLTEGGDIFYVAERMKTPTQGFGLIKFRTMSTTSQDGGVSGGDKAARITPSGVWLRRYRLDELPQLWNVLRGDISFVGPRPPLREYVERFPDLYAAVLASRPGITGLATVIYHRHEEHLLAQCQTAQETDHVYATRCVPYKARLDLIYQRRRTICLDMWLMVRTVIKKG